MPIFPGEAGIWQTLKVMKILALEAARDPSFCHLTSDILRGQRDTPEIIATLQRYVWSQMRYVNDPESFEYVKHPYLIVDEIEARGYAEGDCDDHVVFLAALLTCARIPNLVAALEIPEAQKEGEEGYNHVVNGIPIDSKRFILIDTSVKDGYTGYKITSAMTQRVF